MAVSGLFIIVQDSECQRWQDSGIIVHVETQDDDWLWHESALLPCGGGTVYFYPHAREGLSYTREVIIKYRDHIDGMGSPMLKNAFYIPYRNWPNAQSKARQEIILTEQCWHRADLPRRGSPGCGPYLKEVYQEDFQ